MAMSRFFWGLAASVLAAVIAAPVSAAIIFEDDFNRSNTDTLLNGWSEIESSSADVAIRGNRVRLKDDLPNTPVDAAAAQLGGLSTLGLGNITLMYDWGPFMESETADILTVQWKLASNATWLTLAVHTLGGPEGVLTPNSISLGPDAANKADLQFRFFVTVTDSIAGAWIDNVKLTGEPQPVPEPVTIVLFGAGVLALGSLKWRRRRV